MTSSLLEPPITSLTAAGSWNPAEHPRDHEGKFTEKPDVPNIGGKSSGGGGVGGGGKPLKITHALIHKKHEPGTIIAQSADGKTRVRWSGVEYDIAVKTDKGEWVTGKSVKKSKLYKELQNFSDNWVTPSSDTSAKPKPEPARSKPQAKSVSHVTSMASYEKIGHQAGSQLGALFKDPNGDQQYVKVSKSERHAQNEVLANQLYKAAGVKVPDVGFVTVHDDKFPGHGGKLGTQSKIIKGEANMMKKLSPIGAEGDLDYAKKLREDFAIDAWLANWDVVGTGFDNIITDEQGNPVRIDAGGALLYRAMGGPKGDQFGDVVGEIDTMRNAMTAPYAAQVFKGVTDVDIRKGVTKIEKITPEEIDAFVDAAGFKGATATKLKNTLKARRQNLIDAYGKDASKGEPTSTTPITFGMFFGDKEQGEIVIKSVSGDQRVVWTGEEFAYQTLKTDGKWHTTKTWSQSAASLSDAKGFLKAHGDIWVKPKKNEGKADPSEFVPAVASPTTTTPTGSKVYTGLQKAQVLAVFSKNNVKWHNDTKAIYDSALEVSKNHPDLTMGDALDVMDQSLKKKTGNPFRTKVEKFLKTNAGKQYVYAKGGPASIGTTQPTIQPGLKPPTDVHIPRKMSVSDANKLQEAMNQANPPPLNGVQRAALKTYTGSSYVDINQCLRKTKPCKTQTKKNADHIKAAMKPSVADVVLYRATNPKSFGLTSTSQLQSMVGKTIKDDGAISTSITQGVWAGDMRIEIEAPVGTKMAWARPVSQHPSENEMVLAPGTHFEVISVKPPTGYDGWQVKLRAIPGSETP